MYRRLTRSLTRRLLILLLLVQSGVPILGMAAWMLFSPYVSWDDVAVASAERVVAQALRRQDDGSQVLQATPALRRYAARRPSFRYAVIDRGRVVPGSDPVVRDLITRIGPDVVPLEGQLAVRADGVAGAVRFETGDFGPEGLTFVTAGNRFHAEDWGAFVRFYVPSLVPIFGPSVLAALIGVPLVIRSAMRPLRRAAQLARSIDFSTLSQRLDESEVPLEVLPLVRAVNAALERVEQGAARQRLTHANAAHELRTPVAILRARLDSLPDLPRRHELERDVNRIGLLVEQLLSVERLEVYGTGQEPLDLVSRMRALVADCAPMALRGGVALEFEARCAAAPMRGNGRALDSAVANLIDNALRAEPAGGCVIVRVGPGLVIEVEDHGAGVSMADRAMVFEPFWRKDDRPAGAGLGLSIVREVARLYQGDISVRDTPGGGATFVLTLHDRRPHAPAAAALAAAPPSDT